MSWAFVAVARDGTVPASALALLFKPQLAPLVLVAFVRATSGRARAGFITASTLAIAFIAATVIAVLPWWTAWLRGLTGFTATPPRTTKS